MLLAYALGSTVLLDTGSSDLLLPRSNCTTCGTHNLFDPSASSTFSRLPGDPMAIDFGTDGTTVPLSAPQGARGVSVTDAVTFAGLAAPAQTFFLCDVYGEALAAQPGIDGILGLGPPGSSFLSTANTTVQPLYWALVASGQLPSPEFGLLLRHDDGDENAGAAGELTLGGTDPGAYAGAIATVPLDAGLMAYGATWVVDVAGVFVDGAPLANASDAQHRPARGGVALLDSGTAYMVTPDNATAAGLYAGLGAAGALGPLDTVGSWGGACADVDAAARDFTFALGPGPGPGGAVVNVTLPARFFNLGAYPGRPGVCQAVFVSPPQPPQDPVAGRPIWLIGSPLLKNYYTVWNGVDLTLGVARLRGEGEGAGGDGGKGGGERQGQDQGQAQVDGAGCSAAPPS